jgi:hypothetical protein
MADLNSSKDRSGDRHLLLHYPTMLQGGNAYVGGKTRHSDDDSSDSSPDTDVMKQVKNIREGRTGLSRARNRNSIGSILSSYEKSTASQPQGPPAETDTGSDSEHAITSVQHVTLDEVVIPQPYTDENTIRSSPTEPTVKVSNPETPTRDRSDSADYRQKVEHIAELLSKLDKLQEKMDHVLSEHSSSSSLHSPSPGSSQGSTLEANKSEKTTDGEDTVGSDSTRVEGTGEVRDEDDEMIAQTCTQFEKATDRDEISERVLNMTLCWMLRMVLAVGASTA